MPYERRSDAYAVRVQGKFVGGGRWFVHGRVDYLPPVGDEPSADLQAEARVELLLGIARESRLGREKGARDVHVIIEGDEETRGFFELVEEVSGAEPPSRPRPTPRYRGLGAQRS